jgi:hypothetical protein
MSQPTVSASPHLPRAYLDPIDNASDALAVVHLAMQTPMVPELIGFLLDPHNRGGSIVVVGDVPEHDHDAVCRMVELLSQAAPSSSSDEGAYGLVVASIRPDGWLVDGDADRWRLADGLARMNGVDLLEWFVVGRHGATCPRLLAGDPERW